MKTSIAIRPASAGDVPVLAALIPRSARALSAGFYSPEQIEAAIRYVFGVDSALVRDGTYLVAESAAEIRGCGGWSRRRTLYGGDQHKASDAPGSSPIAPSRDMKPARRAPFRHRRSEGKYGKILGRSAAAFG